MTIVRVGSTEKYSDGWDTAFGGKKRSKAKVTAKKTQPKSRKKAATGKKKSS